MVASHLHMKHLVWSFFLKAMNDFVLCNHRIQLLTSSYSWKSDSGSFGVHFYFLLAPGMEKTSASVLPTPPSRALPLFWEDMGRNSDVLVALLPHRLIESLQSTSTPRQGFVLLLLCWPHINDPKCAVLYTHAEQPLLGCLKACTEFKENWCRGSCNCPEIAGGIDCRVQGYVKNSIRWGKSNENRTKSQPVFVFTISVGEECASQDKARKERLQSWYQKWSILVHYQLALPRVFSLMIT